MKFLPHCDQNILELINQPECLPYFLFGHSVRKNGERFGRSHKQLVLWVNAAVIGLRKQAACLVVIAQGKGRERAHSREPSVKRQPEICFAPQAVDDSLLIVKNAARWANDSD